MDNGQNILREMAWYDPVGAYTPDFEWFWSLQIASASSFAETGSIFGQYSEDQTAMGGSYSIEDIAALCPSLMSVRISSGYGAKPVLYIPHFSVKEFLNNKHAEDFSPRQAHSYFATLCMQIFLKCELTRPLPEERSRTLAITLVVHGYSI